MLVSGTSQLETKREMLADLILFIRHRVSRHKVSFRLFINIGLPLHTRHPLLVHITSNTRATAYAPHNALSPAFLPILCSTAPVVLTVSSLSQSADTSTALAAAPSWWATSISFIFAASVSSSSFSLSASSFSTKDVLHLGSKHSSSSRSEPEP